MYIKENGLDDLLLRIYTKLLNKQLLKGEGRVAATKGATVEISGVLLRIEDPRLRLSRTERKGTLFSCLGELLWYLAGTNDLDHIEYYIKGYEKFSDDKKAVHGGYGPRIFGKYPHDQIFRIIEILKEKPTSRQAVIQIFSLDDLLQKHLDIPCTCSMQFILRGDRLNMITHMRSNDAYKGLPHDIFAFTMLQEIVARSLNKMVGHYTHFVGSLHLYDEDRGKAEEYLKESWQSEIRMPEMPRGDPWPSIRALLDAESDIRKGGPIKVDVELLDPYWSDLIRILEIFNFSKDENKYKYISKKRKQVISRIYSIYIDKIESKKNKKDVEAISREQLSLALSEEKYIIKHLPYLLTKLVTKKAKENGVIPWGCPIPVFGDIYTANIATIGINPSNKEFMDNDGAELDGFNRRFHTLSSLGVRRWSDVDQDHVELISEACRDYFHRAPYHAWFKVLDEIISATGSSYYDRFSHACHLDLVPYATESKWTDLAVIQRKELLKLSGNILGVLIRDSAITVLIANGTAVIRELEKISDVKLLVEEKDSWVLPRRSGVGVPGYAYAGSLSSVAGISLGRSIRVLGFNHNIQSSYGITLEVKAEIRDWIGESFRGEGL
jgi:thymidylate synthase